MRKAKLSFPASFFQPRRRNLWTFSRGIMGKTMKADSPSPRFHGVTPCSPGLITFGLKSLICCWKAVDGAIPDKIFPRSFLPSRWKTFKKIILSRGKIGGRRVSIPTSRHFKINPPRNNYYFFLFFFLLNLINDRIFPLEFAFRCLTSKMIVISSKQLRLYFLQ